MLSSAPLLSLSDFGDLAETSLTILQTLYDKWDTAAILGGIFGFLAALCYGAFRILLVATPFSLAIALASFLSIWLASLRRDEVAVQPRLLSYGLRNVCHSFLLLILGDIAALLTVVLMFMSIFPSGHPDPAIFSAPCIALLLLYPLLFVLFARYGMHFTKRRVLGGLLLFTVLTIALLAIPACIFALVNDGGGGAAG